MNGIVPGTIIGYLDSGKPVYQIAGGSGDAGFTGESTDNSNGGNPAWNEFLSVVPEELHSQVTPILQKWDQGVQERFQKVHSEYEPWKPILDAGINPEEAQFGINLIRSLSENPEMVYNALKEYYKFDDGAGSRSGQGQGEPKPEDDDPYARDIADLKRQNQLMADRFLSQQRLQEQQEADTRLDLELTSLAKKYESHGPFDESYVLAKMQAGKSSEDAVKEFYAFRDQVIKSHTPKPLFMGSGGGLPNSQVNPTKMNDAGVKNLVVQMLEAAAHERNK